MASLICKQENWWSVERWVLRRLYSAFAGGSPVSWVASQRVYIVLGSTVSACELGVVESPSYQYNDDFSAFPDGIGLFSFPACGRRLFGILVALLEIWQKMTIDRDRWVNGFATAPLAVRSPC